ncbi:MAG: hypothetical protein HC799_10345 [Limnothrix sp. RL_2_0]|nr:hypothetical protein [Limnothrix sp. RL_2_0]
MAKKQADPGVLGGLKAAFVFLFAFIILRYNILLSIAFAAIGGFTVSFILGWWKSQDPTRPRRNPFKKLKIRPAKKYPGLTDVRSHTSEKGSLNKQKSPETFLGDQE